MATYDHLRCELCGDAYTGHTTASRYCGRLCKQRAFRARRTAEHRLREFHRAAQGLDDHDLRHLIGEAQRLMLRPEPEGASRSVEAVSK